MIEPRWNFALLDVAEDRTPQKIGRLTAFQPVISYGIVGGRATCAVTMLVRNEDPFVDRIVDWRSRVKAYRVPAWDDTVLDAPPAGVLRAYNVVTGSKDVFGIGGGVQVVTSDASAYLGRRQRQPSSVYTGLGGSSGSFAAVDQGSIVKTLVDDENLRAPTFIRTSVLPVATGVTRNLDVPRDKPIGSQIGELADTFGGFETIVEPIEGDPLYMGDLRVAYPTLGASNLEVYLEHGTGQQNVTGGERTLDTTKLSSDVHVLGRVDGSNQGRVDRSDPAVAAYYRTILDSTDTYGDIGDATLLGSIATALGTWRRGPRELLRLQLADTVGIRPFDDFNLGDVISARVREGRTNIDGSVRVWGFEITPLPTGEERLTGITIEPEAS